MKTNLLAFVAGFTVCALYLAHCSPPGHVATLRIDCAGGTLHGGPLTIDGSEFDHDSRIVISNCGIYRPVRPTAKTPPS